MRKIEMLNVGFLLTLLLPSSACAFNINTSPVTQTTCGPVAGIYQDGANSFRGIPYAEPPVGSLRWKPPRALDKQSGSCWNGTYLANTYGNNVFNGISTIHPYMKGAKIVYS